jgi:hypothetical protein
MNAMHETEDPTSTTKRASGIHAAVEPSAESPVLLSWTDAEAGETLWVEMWATPEFVADLLAQGFEVRPVAEDETATSLFVRILHRGADEA